MSKRLNKYINEAITNIRKDREVTHELLSDLIKIASQSEHNHKEVSMAAAKYVETLQRSNEQLVKLASLIQKEDSKEKAFSFSGNDKESIYDMIGSEEETLPKED